MPKRVVFTYGAYDLLHPGHVRFLKRARGLGDSLILALVTDDAIRIVKGNGKPVMPLKNRVEVMESVRYVDRVMTIDSYNPVPAMEKLKREGIKIDFLVKGNDWEYIPGCEYVVRNGGKLVKLHYTGGFSTTGMIKKIKGG